MGLGSVLFSAKGRIGQKTFWIAYGPMFAASVLVNFLVQSDPGNQQLSAIGSLVGLVLLYPMICVFSKRLHDMGRSGWLQLLLYCVFIAFSIFIASRTFGATMSAVAGAAGDREVAQAAARAAVLDLMASDPVLKFSPLISFAISLAWALWLGLTPGNPGQNRYGPPEGDEDAVQTSVV
jgi:uncharacterized membrane protein YhaH (DUF805 family)